MNMIDDDALPRVRKPTKAQQADIDAMQASVAAQDGVSEEALRVFREADAVLTTLNSIPQNKWTFNQTKEYANAFKRKESALVTRHKASGHQFDVPNAILTELNTIPREDWSSRQFTSYVDALVMLGEFETAYELTKDKKYKKIWDAINGKVSKDCKCRDWESTEMVDGKPTVVKHTRFFVKQEIWNVKTGKTANLVACNVCGRAFVQ